MAGVVWSTGSRWKRGHSRSRCLRLRILGTGLGDGAEQCGRNRRGSGSRRVVRILSESTTPTGSRRVRRHRGRPPSARSFSADPHRAGSGRTPRGRPSLACRARAETACPRSGSRRRERAVPPGRSRAAPTGATLRRSAVVGVQPSLPCCARSRELPRRRGSRAAERGRNALLRRAGDARCGARLLAAAPGPRPCARVGRGRSFPSLNSRTARTADGWYGNSMTG